MNPIARRLCWIASVAVVWGASTASAQLLRTVDAGGGLYAQQVFGRALIHESSGEVRELSLPQGAVLGRLDHLEDGWIASGTVRAPGITDLFLLRSEKGTLTPFPAPPNPSDAALRGDPAPLIESGRLIGLAWTAGPRSQEAAVYVSSWSGVDWSPPVVVSPPGPGTQIAVAGAVLADSSWLLVWAGYDGTDDEILWSRGRGDRWSPPKRLHAPNDSPDIVPTLVGTGSGALAAWSSSDGTTYRVRLARFENDAWREIGLRAPAGSVRPTLTLRGDRALLLYRTVVPSTWTLRELDGRGAPLRRAVVESETTFRPGLVPQSDRPPGFEWPGAEVATPTRVETEWQDEP